MTQEEFNQLLTNSRLPKEFILKINQLVRITNAHEEQINLLLAKLSVLEAKLNETNETI